MRATNRVYILIFFIPMEYFRLRPKVNAKMNKFGSSCNQCGMINFKQSHTHGCCRTREAKCRRDQKLSLFNQPTNRMRARAKLEQRHPKVTFLVSTDFRFCALSPPLFCLSIVELWTRSRLIPNIRSTFALNNIPLKI